MPAVGIALPLIFFADRGQKGRFSDARQATELNNWFPLGGRDQITSDRELLAAIGDLLDLP